MTSEPDERDDEPSEAEPNEDLEPDMTETGGADLGSSPKLSLDLSGLFPKFSEMIRSAMPDVSGLVRLNLPSELLPKTDIFERVYPAFDISDLQGPDLSGLSPAFDFAKVIPGPDLSGIMPRFNFARLATVNANWAGRFGTIVDMSAYFPEIVMPRVGDAFRNLLEVLRESLPPNWPDEVDFDAVTTVIQGDGLPLVWVPRAKIVEEVLAAADREARIAILLSHSDDVMQDCRDLLATITHEELSNQLPLVEKVVDAFDQGHIESAQALAVVVTETVVARVLSTDYGKVRKLVRFDPDKLTIGEVRIKAALAPIGPFYTAWYRSWGTPPPTALSRHVTVHQADIDHYTPGNAIVAVMLATSVLRAVQELLEAFGHEGQTSG